MAKEKQIVIKEADITNNCPVCYNQQLKLSYYQKHTFNPLFHRTTGEVTHEIKCKKCYSIIYPIDRTPDIERVVDYYNKLVEPDRKSVRFTILFFVILIVVLALVGVAIYLYLEGII